MPARTHPQEDARLRALRSFDVLDTEPETLFDALVALATELFDLPIALISLVDAERQWFKARVGFAESQTSLRRSFCAHAILLKDILVIEDTHADARFADNPLITVQGSKAAPIRFYAGATLSTENGLPLGTVCVLGHQPRDFSTQDRRWLGLLRDQAMALLDRRRLQAESEYRTRLKSEFLAHASHEIRTPLASIIGYAELLEGTLHGVEDLEFVRTILRNGGHLKSIVDKLLDLSRIEAGELEIHNAPCALAELLADIDSLMWVRALETGAGWRIECHDALPIQINVDALRLRQILINLAGNALKFCADGEVVLELTSHVTSGSSEEIEFAVRDSGIGMTAEQLERVFAPFAQAQSDTATRYGGSGLGLTISRELATLLGGELHVESEPDSGSVFRLRVPCEPVGAERAVPSISATCSSRETFAPAASALSGRYLLVVDDQDDIRYLAERILERAGAETVTVSGGMHALELLRQGARSDARQFDAIVLDIQMPVLDGFGVLEQMGNDAIDVPAIALTADALTGQRERCMAAGCEAYIAKPFTAQDLVSAALALFAQSRPSAAMTANVDTRTPRREAAPASLSGSASSGAHLLIVEDDDDVADALRRLLSRHGYEVETAGTAKRALTIIARRAPDCILLDRQLPDMDSPELIALLRSDDTLRGTRFISLSGSVMDNAEQKLLGFDLCLQKPVALQVLLDALENVLRGTSGTATGALGS